MKRIGIAVALVLLVSASAAKASLLAGWTFETSVPTTAGPHTAENGINAITSFATGVHASGATAYSNPVGNGSVESFSSNTWAAGDYYQFTTSTLGYTGITIDWCQVRSSTGPGDFKLEGSTDGTNFSALVASYAVLSTPSWSSGTPQPTTCFAAVAAPGSFDNQATVYFRLTSNVSVVATGTNRVDDVNISGTAIPEPGTIGMLALGALALIRRRR